jgi:hypothetical protein
MGDAYVDEVIDAPIAGGGERRAEGYRIDGAELIAFPRRRVRRADQMDQRGAGTYGIGEGVAAKSVTDDHFAAERQPPVRSWPGERADGMPAREKFRDQRGSDVAGASANKNGAIHAYIYA